MSRLTHLPRRLRRTLLARRRLLAALAAAGAVAAGLHAATAPPPPRRMVLTAAHDLAAGHVLRADDLTRVGFAPGTAPAGALGSASAVVGRTTTTPVRAGEPLTDVRLLGASLLAGRPGAVAAPVRIGDAGAVRMLRVGDRVDVLGADPRTGETTTVARDVPVVALPTARGRSGGGLTGPVGGAGPGTSGGLVVLAVSDATARALAGAGVSSYLSVVLTR